MVIPSWDGADLLRLALTSLRRQQFRDFEILVVDNGSRDGTAAMLAADFPEVRSLTFPENRGFAAAVNAGIRESQGEIIALMNNDIEADPGWLGALVGALDRRPEVGSVSSKMLDAADPRRLDSAWDAMGLTAYNVGRGEVDGPRFSTGREAISACAGAAAYRRSLFEDVGYFDEDFFAWFEDVELGIRGQLAGYRSWYEPTSVVFHRGSATGARHADMKWFLVSRNMLVLFFQTMPLRRILIWGPLLLVWPLKVSIVEGGSLRITLRGWLGFWRLLPKILRKRQRIYARRRVPVSHLLGLLDDPFLSALAGVRELFGALRKRPRGH